MLNPIKSLLFVLALALPVAGSAQNQFATKITVNERIITQFELAQRALMITAFGGQGDVSNQAETQLINERLYQDAGRLLNLTVTAEEVSAGMEEFAARGNLNREQILEYLASRGVAQESFRDFVAAGQLWRNVVRARFGQEAAISDEEIDRNLVASGSGGSQSFLLSEIIIPVLERGEDATEKLLRGVARSSRSPAAFSQQARRLSRAPSARRGGRLDWIEANSLPAPILSQVLALQKNGVTAPINLGNAVAIFQLRGSRTTSNPAAESVTLTYATARVESSKGASAQKAAARVMISKADTCLDLRALAGEAAYSENSAQKADIETGLSMALAKLDDNEASFFVNADGSHTVVMLCYRARELPEGERENLRASLFNSKITGLGEGYLQELRAEAYITRQ